MVVGGVLENGPYSGLLPTSNEVWVTAVMVLNGDNLFRFYNISLDSTVCAILINI
jgi:hypothetical protein